MVHASVVISTRIKGLSTLHFFLATVSEDFIHMDFYAF
jgi:hypothetical protein